MGLLPNGSVPYCPRKLCRLVEPMGLAPGFRGIRRKTAKFASLRPIPAFSYVSSEALWSPLDTCNLALSGNSWQQCRLPSELRQFPRPVDSIFHHCYILSMEWD